MAANLKDRILLHLATFFAGVVAGGGTVALLLY